MQLALKPVTANDEDDGTDAACRHQGRELLARARMALGGS